MKEKEIKITKKNQYNVDDILVCFEGKGNKELNNILDFLNMLYPKLKFTLEIEVDNKINFLDLSVERKDNRLIFDIFRKPFL